MLCENVPQKGTFFTALPSKQETVH
jgi:hypothetical protein